ncbi:hypothetical protein ACPF7Z_18265 [Halomonas sp. GXIMD04776]|uniref:hypothetical protein n=1 Tax=Halomonas sp. GXIMD04776 TaxID=3415605 RepID=UPI003CB6F836
MTFISQVARRFGGPIVVMGWGMLGSLSQVSADEVGRGDHGYSWQSDIEIVIDGSRLMTTPSERERSEDDNESGPSICHQADGTTWSTRAQKCPESIPPERSQVWSTSPE